MCIKRQSAYRPSAPDTENRVIAGSSIAFDNPCGTWKCAPIGRDIPCTSATELFLSLIHISAKKSNRRSQ